MRRIVVAVMSTISALVLLFSYHTSTNATSVASGTSTSAGVSPGPTTSSGPAGSTPSAASTSSASTASQTYTGDAVNTRWGPVQVAITVADGKITAVSAVEYPQNNGRDQQINAYALPILAQEATQAQSAKIDAVSGATVTSDGYTQSLQSAIDQAHL